MIDIKTIKSGDKVKFLPYEKLVEALQLFNSDMNSSYCKEILKHANEIYIFDKIAIRDCVRFKFDENGKQEKIFHRWRIDPSYLELDNEIEIKENDNIPIIFGNMIYD